MEATVGEALETDDRTAGLAPPAPGDGLAPPAPGDGLAPRRPAVEPGAHGHRDDGRVPG